MHISNKCSIAVHCLIFINEYGKEKKVTSELLSLSTGCNPVTIRNIISARNRWHNAGSSASGYFAL